MISLFIGLFVYLNKMHGWKKFLRVSPEYNYYYYPATYTYELQTFGVNICNKGITINVNFVVMYEKRQIKKKKEKIYAHN
jgi:hypothetical protein